MSEHESVTFRPRAVRAAINYLAAMDRRPQVVNDDYSKNDMDLVPIEVDICDAGDLVPAPSIDREGFTLATHTVLRDDPQLGNNLPTFRESLVPLMKRLTGADEIALAPSSIVRRQQASTLQAEAPPVHFVHSDYSEKGPEQTLSRYAPPSRSTVRRTALFNMWKLLSPGPTDRPLALCDASTVTPDHLIVGDSRFLASDFAFETAFFRHATEHRWHYYPSLRDDELIVFKQGDTDGAFPRFVPHTAFADRSCPPGRPPRVSMELRCRAVWFD